MSAATELTAVSERRRHLNVGMEARIAEGLEAHEGGQAAHCQAHGRARPEQHQRQQAQRRACRRATLLFRTICVALQEPLTAVCFMCGLPYLSCVPDRRLAVTHLFT